MLISANKKHTSDCSFHFIKSLLWYFSNLKIWDHKKKGKKRSKSIVLTYIADVSVSTIPVIYANIVFKWPPTVDSQKPSKYSKFDGCILM